MTDEALIAWLRSLKGLGWSSEAADRIEALIAERDDAERREMVAGDKAVEYLDRAEAAEAKLAKAVELLKLYVDIDDVGGCERATLAELKGESQ